eukprot:m.124290 g.124290  ORF g.124290 m.124290 type:complete len:77 (-) comp13495_c0_seq1:826-1056(-)
MLAALRRVPITVRASGLVTVTAISATNLSSRQNAHVVDYERAAGAVLSSTLDGTSLRAATLWHDAGAVVMVVRRLG